MKKCILLYGILLVVALPFLGGCVASKSKNPADGDMKVERTALVCGEETPPGETCVIAAKTTFDIGGTKKYTIFATKVNHEGDCLITDRTTGKKRVVKCGAEILGIREEDDRLKSATTGLLGVAGKVVEGEYRVEAAKNNNSGDNFYIQPIASSGSSSYSKGGESVTLNQNSSGSVSQQGTTVGVAQEQSSGGGCKNGGDCSFLP